MKTALPPLAARSIAGIGCTYLWLGTSGISFMSLEYPLCFWKEAALQLQRLVKITATESGIFLPGKKKDFLLMKQLIMAIECGVS